MSNNHWSAPQQSYSLIVQRNPNPSPLHSVAASSKSRSPHQTQRKSAWHIDRAFRKSTLPHMTWLGQTEQCRNLGSQLVSDVRTMRHSPITPNRAGLLGSPLALHGYIRWLQNWWSEGNSDTTTTSWSCWWGMTSQALSATDMACVYYIPLHTHAHTPTGPSFKGTRPATEMPGSHANHVFERADNEQFAKQMEKSVTQLGECKTLPLWKLALY